MSFVRTRLSFQTPPPLYEVQNCWFLVDTSACRIVTDLEYLIQKRFGLHSDSERTSISLFLDGYLLPSQEKIEIIKDGDDISVVETYKPVVLQKVTSEEDKRKRKKSSHQDQRKRSKGNYVPLYKTEDMKDPKKEKKAANKSVDSKTTSKETLRFQKSNHTSVNQEKKGTSSRSDQKQCKLVPSKRCSNAHLVSNSSASYKNAASISEAKYSKHEKAKCSKDRGKRFSGRHPNNKPSVSSSKKKSIVNTVSSNKRSSVNCGKRFDARLKNGQPSSSESSSSSETSEQSGITSTKPKTDVIYNNKSSFNSARYLDVFVAAHKDTEGVKGSNVEKRKSITTSQSSSDSSSSSTDEEEETEMNNIAIPSSSSSAHQVPGTKLITSGKNDSSFSTSYSAVLRETVDKAILSVGSNTGALEEIKGILNETSSSSSDETEGKNKKSKDSLSSSSSSSSSDDKPQGNRTNIRKDVLVLSSLSGGTEDNSKRKAIPLVPNNNDLSTATTTQRRTDPSCKLLDTECKHPLQSNRNISTSTSRLQTIQSTSPEKSHGRTNGSLSKSHIRFESDDEEEEEIAEGNDTPRDILCGLQAAPMVAAKSPATESTGVPLQLGVSTNQSFGKNDLKSPQGSVTDNEKEGQVVKSKDYSQFCALYGPPRVGDTIAYKILELSSSYTPEISQYKEGKVIAFEPNSGTVMLELNADSLTKSRGDGNLTGKFELVYEEDEENTEQVQLDTEVSVPWKSMISPLLLK